MCSPQLRSPLALNAAPSFNVLAGVNDLAPSNAASWRAPALALAAVPFGQKIGIHGPADEMGAQHAGQTSISEPEDVGASQRGPAAPAPIARRNTAPKPPAGQLPAPRRAPPNSARSTLGICPIVPGSRPVGDTGQAGAVFRDPSGGWVAYSGRDDALAAAKAEYPKLQGIDDVRDAFRHFYWVYGMTNVVGAKRALALANSHEAQYPLKTQADVRSRQMDTFNNAVAAKMATDPRWAGMSTLEVARMAIRSGCLDIIKK